MDTTNLEDLKDEIANRLINVEDVLFDFSLHGYTITAVCRKPEDPESFIVVSNDTPQFMDALEEAHRNTIHKEWAKTGHLGAFEELAQRP